jgi:isochorismate pyruvate lyase
LRSAGRRLYAGGMTDPLAPDDCTTMAEVRAGVDAVDRALVALLDTRFGYMRAAARIKPERSQVRDERRKAEVIAAAHADAAARGLPANAVAAMWEQLVEASIAYELERFDAR